MAVLRFGLPSLLFASGSTCHLLAVSHLLGLRFSQEMLEYYSGVVLIAPEMWSPFELVLLYVGLNCWCEGQPNYPCQDDSNSSLTSTQRHRP